MADSVTGSAARRPRSPKCFRPWCGVGGKFCIDCAPLQPRVKPDPEKQARDA